MRNYLAEAVAACKANGLPVIEVIEVTDVTDASINLTPKFHIQMCSPVEFCLVEETEDETFVFSEIVDLDKVILMAKLKMPPGSDRRHSYPSPSLN